MSMFKFLIQKEFIQLRRNPFVPRLIIMFPVVVLLVFPWAADFEMKNINLAVIDNDHTPWSQQLTQKVNSSGYIRLTNVSSGYKEALHQIETDQADVILELPAGFEKDLATTGNSKVLISSNTVNGTKGGLSSYYLLGIINDFASDVRIQSTPSGKITNIPKIEIVSQNRFNTNLNYKVFMVPALMVMILTMLCGFLPAMNIVLEKEKGTIEQMNVTPVSRFAFILSKLIPFWIIGLVVITISFGVAFLVYGLFPRGSLGTIYFFAAVYILGVSGLGLVISNYSETLQQAMFVIYFFMMILIVMSGLFTPINSMPRWAQTITWFNPLKYMMQVMRMVFLKGSGFSDLHGQFFALAGFALFFNTWAVWSYRKRI
jgi:ABC-2 type transport system permease protein